MRADTQRKYGSQRRLRAAPRRRRKALSISKNDKSEDVTQRTYGTSLQSQATGLAHGPSLRDEAKPGHIPSQAACQQAPQSVPVDGELSASCTVPTIFFLGFKGYLQPSCLGPLARVGESSWLATGVNAADKRRKAKRGGNGIISSGFRRAEGLRGASIADDAQWAAVPTEKHNINSENTQNTQRTPIGQSAIPGRFGEGAGGCAG
ncbi:hypothetical protein GBF38_001505 [Nibea albiflora]|uniref:Uncharacterized protein n=1 Tax=Nibea albiflora TaxID=240163 RepID=A0ACB7EUI9_NIBAL|nr:hypothetical protein GBF38_001505 [Nibea albiflora]